MSKFTWTILAVGVMGALALVGYTVENKYGTVSSFTSRVLQRSEKKFPEPFRDKRCNVDCASARKASEVNCHPIWELRLCPLVVTYDDVCDSYVSCIFSEQDNTCVAQVAEKQFDRCISCADRCEEQFDMVSYEEKYEKMSSCIRRCIK